MMLMDRTTISLPPELHKRLRIMAAERGVSMASLIREAVEEKIASGNGRARPKPRFGIFDSGRTDLSMLASEGTPEPPPWRSS
jgi:plasmid stability protein